jgi:Zn-dependent protease with chaperone function
MNTRSLTRRLSAAALAATLWILPVTAIAQTTQLKPLKNKYKVQDDVKLGSQASAQVEQQFPVIRDRDISTYIERVGRNLVASIPQQFQQPAFRYTFEVVNASDINAFALPGGPMYVNRGMIEAARNEGEMAGVMAHEISHVAMRHATAQATKQSSTGNTLRTLGLILGGAVVGGQAGAQLGALGASIFTTKYSREYETQADLLGARIMADAGYDPRDLANMFRTIQGQRSGGGPEWLSSHPDPGNRFEKINREASYLNVSRDPIKITRDFERVKSKLQSMPRARTMAEIQRSGGGGGGGQVQTSPTSTGRYGNVVQRPSTQFRTYSGSSWLSISVPSNWRDFPSDETVQFAPEGAYGDQGITHGVMIGVLDTQNRDLAQASNEYLNQITRGNTYLRQQDAFTRTTVGSRQGLTTSLSGRSPITGRTELVEIYTTQFRNGQLFYAVTVVPADEADRYAYAFRNVLTSVRFND